MQLVLNETALSPLMKLLGLLAVNLARATLDLFWGSSSLFLLWERMQQKLGLFYLPRDL